MLGALLGGKVGLIAVGVLGVSALSLGAVAKVQAARIAHLKAEAKVFHVSIQTLQAKVSAYETNYRVLQAAHESCMNEIKLSAEASSAAVASVNQAVEAIRRGAEDVRRERATIQQLPGCKELAEVDIAERCPEWASSLRARADRVSAPR